MVKDRKDREIVRKSEEIQRLQLNLDTATVDRDYYKAQRDRKKEEAVNWHTAYVDERTSHAQTKQALRQIIQAVESESDDKLDAILRIARVAAGP